jgi:hypothetical protein
VADAMSALGRMLMLPRLWQKLGGAGKGPDSVPLRYHWDILTTDWLPFLARC